MHVKKKFVVKHDNLSAFFFLPFRGRGDDGRLGHGDTGWKYVPKITQALQGQMVVQVTCGSYHTAAVTETGELWTWGGGMYGKLGHGNERGESNPKRVEALANIPVSQIACGSRHTAVVTTRGDVYTWYVEESRKGSGRYVYLGILTCMHFVLHQG